MVLLQQEDAEEQNANSQKAQASKSTNFDDDRDGSDGFETASEAELGSDDEGGGDQQREQLQQQQQDIHGEQEQKEQLKEHKEQQLEQIVSQEKGDSSGDASNNEEMIQNALSQANEAKLEGNKLFGEGKYEEALLQYELALQVAPEVPSSVEIRSKCHSYSGVCFLKMGKYDSTVKECTKALELNPGYFKALVIRGGAHEKLEHFEEAIADMKKVLEIDPLNAQARKSIRRLEPLATEKHEKMKEEMIGTKAVTIVPTEETRHNQGHSERTIGLKSRIVTVMAEEAPKRNLESEFDELKARMDEMISLMEKNLKMKGVVEEDKSIELTRIPLLDNLRHNPVYGMPHEYLSEGPSKTNHFGPTHSVQPLIIDSIRATFNLTGTHGEVHTYTEPVAHRLVNDVPREIDEEVRREKEKLGEIKKKQALLEEQLKMLKGHRGLGIEELSLAPEIVILKDFKLPDFVKYDGTTNPHIHLRSFCTKLGVWSRDEKFFMYFFPESLTGPAADWYWRLDLGNIHTWEQLAKEFIKQYGYNEGKLAFLKRGAPGNDKPRPFILTQRGERKIIFINEHRSHGRNYLRIQQFQPHFQPNPNTNLFNLPHQTYPVVQPYHNNPAPQPQFRPSNPAIRRPNADEPFPNIPMSRTELVKQLINANIIRPVPMRPLIPPYPYWYNANLTCDYHSGGVGHSVETCLGFKKEVLQLIRSGAIQL